MNYIIELILVGTGLYFLAFFISLTSKISFTCACKDNMGMYGIPYVFFANVLFPIYLSYYFFFRSTLKNQSCFIDN